MRSALLLAFAAAACLSQARGANTIFLHPDGTGANHWSAARTYWAGPDGLLNWDRLPEMALYRGHMLDLVAGTSNGGATVHAFGYKVVGPGSFGKDGDGTAKPPTDRFINSLSGYRGSLMREAQSKGHPVGIVNDGHVGEPGTACFLAEVGSRRDWDTISLQVLMGRPGMNDKSPQVILGGGEKHFLGEGVPGVHGPGARKDGKNLIAEAQKMGYSVIRTRAAYRQMMADLAKRPNWVPKVLGLFATDDIFNDQNEEALIAAGMVDPSVPRTAKTGNLILWGGKPGTPSYMPPTMAEMTRLALIVLQRASRKAGKPFFLVAEPESCDNLANASNAIGALNALKRADDAIGEILAFQKRHKNTFVITAADSDANGMQLLPATGNVRVTSANPGAAGTSPVEMPLDGMYGAGTDAFVAAPDQFGRRLSFAVAWAADDDVTGGILSRASGPAASLLRTRFSQRFDSVDVYRMLHHSLFGGAMLAHPTGRKAPTRR